MTSKSFVINVLLSLLISVTTVVGLNVYIDTYGIFRNNKISKKYKIYNNEIVDKTMYSLSYVPKNFDGIILGPSYSANIDTKVFTPERQIYNLSVRGIDINVFENALNNLFQNSLKTKYIILCLDPYFFDIKKKVPKTPSSVAIALGSMDLFKRYLFILLDRLNVKVSKSNEYGYLDYVSSKNEDEIKREIEKSLLKISKSSLEKININNFEKSLLTLSRILKMADAKDVKVYGYFHPRIHEDYKYNLYEMKDFKKRVVEVFGKNRKIIDYNRSSFYYFTKDLSNYADLGHLSNKGAEVFANKLLEDFADL